MKLKIEFFKDDFNDAITAGIYEVVCSSYNTKEILLYIGESKCVISRCATHLYSLNKNSNYFGFSDERIKDENITLKFRLLNVNVDVGNSKVRKAKQTELIKELKPIMQTGKSDYMIKNPKEKIDKFEEIFE